jgi:hypothetical protein
MIPVPLYRYFQLQLHSAGDFFILSASGFRMGLAILIKGRGRTGCPGVGLGSVAVSLLKPPNGGFRSKTAVAYYTSRRGFTLAYVM